MYFEGHDVLFEAEDRDVQLLCDSMVPVLGVAARLADIPCDELLQQLTDRHDETARSMTDDFVRLARAEALVIFGDGRHAFAEVRPMITASEDDLGVA